MGWYGGQEGAARLRWRDQSRAAYQRFRSSLGGGGVKLTSFYDRVVDNRDYKVSEMLIRNPMSQDELVRAIVGAAPGPEEDGTGGGWAVVIAASETLTDLSLLSDVAGRITGLFLYGCRELKRAEMEEFFSKLVNLESLTLVSCSPRNMYREDGVFLKTTFGRGCLPKLRFLESDAATDDAIAAMTTAPDLSAITFSYPTADITNDGFQRLVDAGGAKQLERVSAGTLQKHLSKSLTSKYMAATLPKLGAMNEWVAEQYLTHMAKGKKKKSAEEIRKEKYAAEDSRPFAVVPPERMTYTQLKVALERRGVTKINKAMYGGEMKKNPKAEDLRKKLVDEVGWTHEQELAFQNEAKLSRLRTEAKDLRSRAAGADKDIAKLGKLPASKQSKLYPLLNASDIDRALRANNVRIPSTTSKRRDDRAQVLHNSGYQGGGGLEAQLKHYEKISSERHSRVAKKEEEMQALETEMAKYDTAAIKKKASKAGIKRHFQLIS